MEKRLLVFDSYSELNYWFKQILEELEKTELVFRFKKNIFLRIGPQEWIFKVREYNGKERLGYRCPIFYGLANELEKNMPLTLIKIFKGEDIKHKK